MNEIEEEEEKVIWNGSSGKKIRIFLLFNKELKWSKQDVICCKLYGCVHGKGEKNDQTFSVQNHIEYAIKVTNQIKPNQTEAKYAPRQLTWN